MPLLADAFDLHGKGNINSDGSSSSWLSPAHWQLKPFAQVMHEAVLCDRFDQRFSQICFAALPNAALQQLHNVIGNSETTLQFKSLQSTVYRILIGNLPNTNIIGTLRIHNFRHFRKLKNPLADRLCDSILLECKSWPSTLGKPNLSMASSQSLSFAPIVSVQLLGLGKPLYVPFAKARTAFSVSAMSRNVINSCFSVQHV